MKSSQLLLATTVALLCLFGAAATGRADVLALEKKTPKRPFSAVRKATRDAITGYQGASTTKNAKPKAPPTGRKDVLALEKKSPKRDKSAVRKATRLSMFGYQGQSTTK